MYVIAPQGLSRVGYLRNILGSSLLAQEMRWSEGFLYWKFCKWEAQCIKSFPTFGTASRLWSRR